MLTPKLVSKRWLARLKNIVCAMNKTHHLFYLHYMVRSRNSYTAKCYANGRKPVLPNLPRAKSPKADN